MGRQVRPARSLVAGLGVALLSVCGCGRIGIDDKLPGGYIQLHGSDGASSVVRRIDGDKSRSFDANILPEGRQHVVLTGWGGGTDQSSIIVFDADGRRLMSHRVSGNTPAGYRQLSPSATSGDPYVHDGHRLMAVSTGGIWVPWSVEILDVESEPKPGLVPRFRFWNPGTVNTPVFGDGLMAFRCLNNNYRAKGDKLDYPLAVCVLSLDQILESSRGGAVGEGIAPTGEGHPGEGFLRYFVLGELEAYDDPNSLTVAIKGGIVTARIESGLTYVLYDKKSPDAEVQLKSDATYRPRPEEQPTEHQPASTTEEHVEILRRTVKVYQA